MKTARRIGKSSSRVQILSKDNNAWFIDNQKDKANSQTKRNDIG